VYLDIIKDRLYTHGKNSLSRRATQIVLKEILSTIVPLSAPILSFTCEEIWQYFDWKDTDSVFLTEFPQINTQYINEDLAIAWDRILQIREIVTGELEKFRVKGLIGSSLEAEIILDLPPNDKKLFEEYAGDIATLFIVSYATIRQNDKDIIVTVQKARGKKCIRCWCYHEDVGKNTLYPELCPKCVSVIAEYC
jgi:isoleucyl-tRNA synthetase